MVCIRSLTTPSRNGSYSVGAMSGSARRCQGLWVVIRVKRRVAISIVMHVCLFPPAALHALTAAAIEWSGGSPIRADTIPPAAPAATAVSVLDPPCVMLAAIAVCMVEFLIAALFGGRAIRMDAKGAVARNSTMVAPFVG